MGVLNNGDRFIFFMTFLLRSAFLGPREKPYFDIKYFDYQSEIKS